MSIDSDKIDSLGCWKAITVSELIGILVKLPPMVPVVAEDEDTKKIKFINFVEIDDDGNAPVFIITTSNTPKSQNPIVDMTYEERLARQKQIAMHQTKMIEDETQMGELVE